MSEPFKPRLALTKRTKQLQDAEPLVLKTDGTVDGSLWTTRGEYEMQPEDKVKLKLNLAGARHRAVIQRLANAVFDQADSWFWNNLCLLMPSVVLDAAEAKDSKAIDAWMLKNGMELIQDGLTSVIKRRGEVLSTMSAEVPEQYRCEVTEFIAMVQKMEQGNKNGGAA